MRKVALALVAVLLGACSGGWEAQDPARYAKGHEVYTTYCTQCHGENGEGQVPENPLAPDETGRYPAPPHGTAGHTWHHDDDLLVQIVKNGGMGDPKDFHVMPPFGEILTDEQIDAVLFYIKGFWTDEQREIQRRRTEMIQENSG